jgi:hypothetical protein
MTREHILHGLFGLIVILNVASCAKRHPATGEQATQPQRTDSSDEMARIRELIERTSRPGDRFPLVCGAAGGGARLREGVSATNLTRASIEWDGSRWVAPGGGPLRIPYAFDYDRVGELGFTREQISSVLRQAFSVWAGVISPLDQRFYEVDWRPRERPGPGRRITTITFKPFIRVSWAAGNHGRILSHQNFDTFDTTEAGHAFRPRGEMTTEDPDKVLGGICLNTALRWSADGVGGTDIVGVAIHEIGHALGLGHSDNSESVMYPIFQGNRTLAAEDIAMIRLLYP